MPYGFNYYKFDVNRFDEKKNSLNPSDIIKLSEIYKKTIEKLQKDNIVINDKTVDKVYKNLKEIVNIADKNYISLNKVLNEKEIISESIVNNIKKYLDTDIKVNDYIANNSHKTLKDKSNISDTLTRKIKPNFKDKLNIEEKDIFNVHHKNNTNINVADSETKNFGKLSKDITSVSDTSNRIIKPHPMDLLNIEEIKKFSVGHKKNTNINIADDVQAKIKEIPVIIFIKGITVNFSDFKIKYSSNNIISTCSFTVEDPSDTILDICTQRAEVKVILLDKDISYFGGRIVSNPIKAYGTLKTLSVTVEDYTSESADFIVAESYRGKVTDIIKSMWESYYEYDFLTDIYPSSEEIEVKFNYETLFDATEYLVKYLGWHWYVDFDGYTRVLKVFPPKTNLYKATINQDKVLYETCNFTLDNNIVNAVYFFGGEAKSEFITERIISDGVNNVYKLSYSPIEIKSLYVGDCSQTFGVENSEDNKEYDVVVNCSEKTLKWKDDKKPSKGIEIKVVYKYSYPIVVYMENEASIEQYGKIVKRIENSKIATPYQARKAAEKYINENSQPKFTGSFQTLEPGIKAGMYVNLDLPRYKAVGVFYAAEVEIKKEAQVLVKKVKLNKVMDPAVIYAGKLKELSKRITNLENEKKENVIVNRFKCISQDIILKDEVYSSFGRSGSFVFDEAKWNRADFS
ncbi:hypothetical protein ACFIJ5_17920 (plasmid) [Haloimpatiens sp. FM7330]|uniref:hypothetical protein n=1 Tax=Haloimpatiens sp. FM7330 TaxID=3298610 RepID=UPI00363DBF27